MSRFVTKMFDMLNGKGIGLAAPQVGISKRVIIIWIDGFKHAIINPIDVIAGMKKLEILVRKNDGISVLKEKGS